MNVNHFPTTPPSNYSKVPFTDPTSSLGNIRFSFLAIVIALSMSVNACLDDGEDCKVDGDCRSGDCIVSFADSIRDLSHNIGPRMHR